MSGDDLLELMDVGVRCVDNPVGPLFQIIEPLPLEPNTVDHGSFPGQRVGTPGFRESTDQHFVFRLKKEKLHSVTFVPELIENAEEGSQKIPLPDVYAQSDPVDTVPGLNAELDKLRQELRGQIVHAKESQIFEVTYRVAFTRAGKSADNDELYRFHVDPTDCSRCNGSSLSRRRIKIRRFVLSEQTGEAS